MCVEPMVQEKNNAFNLPKSKHGHWTQTERLFRLQKFQYAPKWILFSIFRSSHAEAACSDLG